MIKAEDLERFQKAEKEVLGLLNDNQSIDVISGYPYVSYLYLNKSGEWYTGFDLMGCSIGKNPEIAVLLKEYIYVLTGHVVSGDKVTNDVALAIILDSLIGALNETAARLRKLIEISEKKINPIRILICKECKRQIDEVGCISTCRYDNGSMNRNPETLEYWVYEFSRIEACPSK